MNINVNVNINVNFDSLEEFKKFCKVLYLEREYPNHLGNADWLIISDLSEEEIQRRFSEVLSKYIPYILVNSEVGEAILSSKRKAKQLQMADSRYLDCYDVTEPDFISYHRELIENNFEDFYILLQDVRLLNKYLNKLNPDQRRRLRKYYYDGKNYSQIAREEGVNHSTVRKSVKAGLKNLKKLFEKGCQ